MVLLNVDIALANSKIFTEKARQKIVQKVPSKKRIRISDATKVNPYDQITGLKKKIQFKYSLNSINIVLKIKTL